MINKISVLVLLIVIQIFATSHAHAAFCSLRDPVSAIQMLYDEGYQYRSLVTTVTEEDRLSVKAKLPFTLHQSEVGKHTLYILYKDDKLDGFLQARSEWAKWGLVEIAWAINADRSLKGFYFQRCRSPQCNDNVVQSINAQIQNKTFEQLKAFISYDGEQLSPEGIKAFSIAPSIALLTLRSALKTLAITDISWKKSLVYISSEIN